jgi:hypothetical protein
VTYLPHLCLLRVFVCWCRTNGQQERYPFVSTVLDLYRPRDWECWRDTHRDRDIETQRHREWERFVSHPVAAMGGWDTDPGRRASMYHVGGENC